MDRFYPSTAAYDVGVAAKAVESSDELAPRWPEDLPQPRLVLLLAMSDEERMQRLRRARGAAGWGPTEERQVADARLALRIAAAYGAMADAADAAEAEEAGSSRDEGASGRPG